MKPKTIRLSRDTGKVITWAFSSSDGLPIRQVFYLFKFDQKTYFMFVTYTTSSAKDKKLVQSVENMGIRALVLTMSSGPSQPR